MKNFAFHSINHWCTGEGGHFYHYHCCVQKAAQAVTNDVNVYVPLSASFVSQPKGWTKRFNGYYNKKSRRKFTRDCHQLFKRRDATPRVFFLEFFGRRDFAIIALQALFHLRKRDHFWILYRDDPTLRRSKDKKTFHFYSKLLQWRLGDRFLQLTDSEQLADYYSDWFHKRPVVLPIPHTSYKTLQRQQRDRIICFVPGVRQEQGVKVIQTLVNVKDSATKKFEISIPGNLYLPPETNEVKISLRKCYLSSEEYERAINDTDLFLLPYDPISYKRRTSGPFVEAITLGKMPVVLKGSWLAAELSRFDLDQLCVDWTSKRFFSHLLSLYEDPKIWDKLKKMQEHYLNYHSQNNFNQNFKELFQKVMPK